MVVDEHGVVLIILPNNGKIKIKTEYWVKCHFELLARVTVLPQCIKCRSHNMDLDINVKSHLVIGWIPWAIPFEIHSLPVEDIGLVWMLGGRHWPCVNVRWKSPMGIQYMSTEIIQAI